MQYLIQNTGYEHSLASKLNFEIKVIPAGRFYLIGQRADTKTIPVTVATGPDRRRPFQGQRGIQATCLSYEVLRSPGRYLPFKLSI